MATFGELAEKWAGNFRTSFDERGITVMECGLHESGPQEVWVFTDAPDSFPLEDSLMTQQEVRHDAHTK